MNAAATETARAVAIIMDGNGRWADSAACPWQRATDLARALRRTVEAAIDFGVESPSAVLDRELDASGRRGGRPDGDLRRDDRARAPDLAREGVRVRFVGRRDGPAVLLRQMEALERHRREHPPPALDLLRLRRARGGGRGRAAIVASGVGPDAVDEADRLEPGRPRCPTPTCWSGRPASCGSNFLLWQLAYAGLVFTETLWPDFDADDLRAALDQFTAPPTVRQQMKTSRPAWRSRCRCWRRPRAWPDDWWLFASPWSPRCSRCTSCTH